MTDLEVKQSKMYSIFVPADAAVSNVLKFSMMSIIFHVKLYKNNINETSN